MNNTAYKPRIMSPYQVAKRKALDTQNEKHPIREEVQKNLKTYNFTATIEEDTQTAGMLKHIPGVVAFLCTMKKDNQIIGQGRGTAVLSKINRFAERTVRFAVNAALIDATVRSVKVMDVLDLDDGVNQEADALLAEAYQAKEKSEGMISDKQRGYLIQLIHTKITDENERNEMTSRIDGMTKLEASQQIAELK